VPAVTERAEGSSLMKETTSAREALDWSKAGLNHAALWHSSMFEFLSGVDVTDFSDTISGEDFQQLFGS
jgi:hypothetical protein